MFWISFQIELYWKNIYYFVRLYPFCVQASASPHTERQCTRAKEQISEICSLCRPPRSRVEPLPETSTKSSHPRNNAQQPLCTKWNTGKWQACDSFAQQIFWTPWIEHGRWVPHGPKQLKSGRIFSVLSISKWPEFFGSMLGDKCYLLNC